MAKEIGGKVLAAAMPHLWNLLLYEWGLDKSVKDGLRNLENKLESMHAFLEDVSGMPPDLELQSHVKIWAHQIRELSRAIEKHLHSFMARIESTKDNGTLRSAVSMLLINHEMDNYIKKTLIKVKDLHDHHGTYPFKSSLESTSTRKVDPRILAMYTKESNPVGIKGAIADLTEKLSKGDHVSIVGMGGMGKTTLARAVYDKMEKEGDFDCKAFFHIGQGADPEKILKDIFSGLQIEISGHDQSQLQLANQLQEFLAAKRCLFVIDDIWNKETWNLVERVLKGSARSKIITTSRGKIPRVGGVVYNIKPLSPAKSKKLLRTKMFGAEAKSHDTEFDKLSENILPKCGGVPMVITVIGSILAKKQPSEWQTVCDSVGFNEHKEDGAYEKVMHYSYIDLPYHLRSCFLYLSLFPDGHWIEKNMLIWRWVAEGLISDGLFETGETYFNELIDRSMIQWAVSPHHVGQGGCRIHSLMLDLIRDLSSSENENFSTVLGMKQESISQTRPIHRLAIHKTFVGQNQNTSLKVGDVLSFYASTCSGSNFPPLSTFAHLRVIDLEGCDLSAGDCKLEDLGKLNRLKYIGLVGTPVAKLPMEKGDFKFLQTLDMWETGISELPQFVEELGKLRCLRAGKGTRMMGRIGKLTSLEELWLYSADKSPDFAADLRKLTELRVMVIHFDKVDKDMQKVLVESLGHLNKLQILQIWFDTEGKVRLYGWEDSVPYPELRQLLLFGVILSKQTLWIHHLAVRKLSKLLLQVETLEAQHLMILGQMPSLRSLYLHSEEDMYRLSYTANKNEFKVLEYLNTNIELICGAGALPAMRELEVGGIRAGEDVGLRGNMPLLERATYHLDCQWSTPLQVQKAEEELRQASRDHPNRPNISIKRWNNDLVELQHSASMLAGSSPRPSDDEIWKAVDRVELAFGKRHTLAVLDAPERTSSPSQTVQGSSRQVHAESDAARDAPAMRNSVKCLQMALLLWLAHSATAENNGWSLPVSDYSRWAKLIMPDIISDMAEETDGPTNGQAESSGAGASREPPREMQVDTDSVLSWFSTPEGDAFVSEGAAAVPIGHVPFSRIFENCLRNPKMIASMSSAARNGDFPDMPSLLENNRVKTVMVELMIPDIMDYLEQTHYAQASAKGVSDTASNLFSLLNSPEGAALMSEGPAEFGINEVTYKRMWKNCMLNPKFIAAMDSAVHKNDYSEPNQLLVQLMEKEIMNYFAEQDIDGPSSRPPPKVNADRVLSWINSPRGAAFVSAGAAQLGLDPVVFERIWKKCWLNPKNPEMIAAVHSALQNDDDYEIKRLLAQLMTEETINYFVEQYRDEHPPRLDMLMVDVPMLAVLAHRRQRVLANMVRTPR